MIQSYVVITNADAKSKEYIRDYSLNGESVIIPAVLKESLGPISSNSIVILHASDILFDTTLQKEILSLIKEKSWTFYLFTNASDSPSRKIEGFNDIYTWNYINRRWNDIKRSFPAVLPLEETSSELLMALYLLCKGYIDSLERLNSSEKIKNWWKLAKGADFKTEIERLKEDEDADIKPKVEGLIDHLKLILDTEPFDTSALPVVVHDLHTALSDMEQNGRFL
jgi:hypothetical protein